MLEEVVADKVGLRRNTACAQILSYFFSRPPPTKRATSLPSLFGANTRSPRLSLNSHHAKQAGDEPTDTDWLAQSVWRLVRDSSTEFESCITPTGWG